MHDIRLIRDNPDAFDAAMARRGLSGVSGELLSLDETRRAAILAAETAQAEANKAAKEVGAAKGRGDEAEFERLRALVGEKKSEIARLNDEAKALDAKLTEILMGLPNTIYDDVPAGEDEDDNVEINRWGTPREMDFKPVEHYELPAVQSGLDFETAAKLSGSRFMVLSGAVARTHRALAQFMLDVHTEENGLTETWTPVLVKEEMMYGTGQLPKFGEDSYKTEDGWWLVPTAEVSLTNIVNGETVSEGYLPRRYVAHTQCFRSEAGSAGRDTAGMLRQHQFEKVEMVSVTKPEESEAEHARMTRCAEDILERLELPYRTVKLCTGDIGFGAKRTHDIEVWLPGQNTYREISSVSTCGDFQARRMNARFKPAEGGKPQFVHTLNGSGLAVGRALIAVLENGQQADGSVDLPAALHPYLRCKTRITAEGELV
ncbi:Serine--tRNA ligase [Aliiroseovarius sp. xm-m-379]|uniref:serine--tRNA ligase n=1 Tax=unclassified Aliiroseovarius TaxID=2623558 RepID=UPI0015695176|nr:MULTISPECIES: serine--tRNA ligase [unclassified Aliiroseovarius]NRP12513.1 Serine--tRNA ligase [Aliiroseovarius sp. xm-d-517]NRP24887.1 Serine--tRNA ligase [Aliiroseovarius sp. xm-m-379]NRP30477.1 Serine--tRNA ligase [Aliiroseovarius sp. xm-m-314]NRP33686.1 Serine--tRNA ligase [Aliiroseovarius sp. xm-a-104]NRP40793.1 Serine--tRNA ligase [Aliiroseovarius sp. xm-m-339-2]